MGGHGSSRWGWTPRKRQVEECSVFDLDAWISAGLLLHEAGRIQWNDPYTGSEKTVVYFLRATDVLDCKYVEILYAQSDGTLQHEPTTIVSRPQSCGTRWYFFCLYCGRQVRKLFSIRAGGTYRCRHCCDLTHRSAQQHNKSHDVFRRNPYYLLRVLEAGSLQAASFLFNAAMGARTPLNVRITPMEGSWDQCGLGNPN